MESKVLEGLAGIACRSPSTTFGGVVTVENLYDDLLHRVIDLVDIRRRMQHRMESITFTARHRRDLGEIRTLTAQPGLLRSARQQQLLKDALAGEDMHNPTVRALLTPAPLLTIAHDLHEAHQPQAVDLAQLKPLQMTRVRVTAGSAPQPIFAAILGLAAIFASVVPKEVFLYLHLQNSYNLYRTLITAVTLLLLVYAAMWFAPAYRAFRHRKVIDAIATEVIEHLQALGSGDSPSP